MGTAFFFPNITHDGNEISFGKMVMFQDQEIRIDSRGKWAGGEIKFTRTAAETIDEELVTKRAKKSRRETVRTIGFAFPASEWQVFSRPLVRKICILPRRWKSPSHLRKISALHIQNVQTPGPPFPAGDGDDH